MPGFTLFLFLPSSAAHNPSMWPHHFINLLFACCREFISAIGTTTLGVTSSLLFMGFSIIASLVRIRRRHGVDAMMNAWKEDGKTALRTTLLVGLIIYGPVFLFTVAKTLYQDHQALVARVNQLFAENEQLRSPEEKQKLTTLQAEANRQRNEAKYWQEAYSAISKGEQVPDRILDAQQADALYQELSRLSKDARNKEWASVEIGAVTDREATRLAWQLLKIFQQAHWNAKWRKEPGIIGQNPSYSLPLRVTLWTDHPNNMGVFLGGALRDVSLQADVNPAPLPPDFKGTIIWVGYKQWP